MNPKDKAIELVNKYNNNAHLYYSVTIEQAKICALIAVNEILLQEASVHSVLDKSTDYWQEIKIEIEKL